MLTTFGLRTGYSDHSEGIAVPIAATTMGAILIEKHFTLDKALSGPDHKSSLEPNELIAMIMAIRTVEQAIGDGVKGPTSSELNNKSIVRKSLIAKENIKKGEKFTEYNLTIKRPGTGISPMEYWDLIGEIAQIDIMQDKVIE